MARPNDDCAIRDLPAGLRAAARRYGGHRATIFEGRELDFAAVGAVSDRAAAALARRGVRPGDRVAIWAPNCDAFVIAYAAILKAGAAVVPINVLYHPREVEYILRDSQARALLAFDRFAEAARALRPALPDLLFTVALGQEGVGGAGGGEPEGDVAWTELCAEPGVPPELAIDPAEDLAALLYTSGTTGRPKGAMLTHRNLLANTRSVRQALRLEPGRETFLVVLPLFHSFAATVGMLFPLLNGCSMAILPRFEPELVARTIEETGATIFLAVPSMYAVLSRLGPEHSGRLASLRFGVSGGAALPERVREAFESRFDKLIYEGDGPTECSPVTCVNPIDGLRKPRSVGLPIPDVEMKILDDEGRERPDGETGEICVRGPNVMKGYWKRPEETRECFFGEWFRTGDLGYRDRDGYFFIVDRKKDLIIVNGMNVYPRVVEEALLEHPAVREAAVVGDPHALHGEIPVAWVALREGASASEEDLRAFLRERLGQHEVPRRTAFVEELPRNATGKILKRELRRQGELERGVDIGG